MIMTIPENGIVFFIAILYKNVEKVYIYNFIKNYCN